MKVQYFLIAVKLRKCVQKYLGIVVYRFRFSKQFRKQVAFIAREFVYRSRDALFVLYQALMILHVKYGVQI